MQTSRFATDAGRPQIWAVGGGKGGTGKSLVAASLGIHLAQMGRRVVLVDGDLGTPNLHNFLGIESPRVGLYDFVTNGTESLDAAAVETGVPRLRLISGARNSLDLERIRHFQKTRLLRLLLTLPADVVLVDLGAGTSLTTMDFFSIADRGLLVILPEPTSIENCYRFLKAAFLRRLQHLGRTLGYQPIIDLVLEHRARSRMGQPGEVLEEIRRIDSCAAQVLESHLEGFLPHLVVNQARAHDDVRLGESIQTACDRFVGIQVCFAGAIPYDPTLVRSIKTRRPYLVEYPRTHTAESFRAVAETVRAGPAPVPADWAGRPSEARRFLARDPYRILDLEPGAAPAEIISAYTRLRSALRSDCPALVSLDCEPERRAALADLEAAFRMLSRNISSVENRSAASKGNAVSRPAPALPAVPSLEPVRAGS